MPAYLHDNVAKIGQSYQYNLKEKIAVVELKPQTPPIKTLFAWASS